MRRVGEGIKKSDVKKTVYLRRRVVEAVEDEAKKLDRSFTYMVSIIMDNWMAERIGRR